MPALVVLLRLRGVKKSGQDMRLSWLKERNPGKKHQVRPWQAGSTLQKLTNLLKFAKQNPSVLGWMSELLWDCYS